MPNLNMLLKKSTFLNDTKTAMRNSGAPFYGRSLIRLFSINLKNHNPNKIPKIPAIND